MSYGTPGIGVKLLGKTKEKMSPAGKMVLDIYDKFIRSTYLVMP